MSASVSAIERRVIVEGWTLGMLAQDSEQEPRIQDVELGARLKIKDPRKIRQLIKSMVSAGIFSPCAVMHPGGITGGRPATEFWLTEEEALLVATRSNAEGALAITREMIRVFMLARRGLLPQAANQVVLARLTDLSESIAQITVALANLSTALAANTQRIDALEARAAAASAPHGRISTLECSRILQAFREIATLSVGPRVKGDAAQNRAWSRARTAADHKTRYAARHPMGRSWHTLDPRELNATWQRIDELREDARALARTREDAAKRVLLS